MKTDALIKYYNDKTGLNDDTNELRDFIGGIVNFNHDNTLQDIEEDYLDYRIKKLGVKNLVTWGLDHRDYLDKVLSKTKYKKLIEEFSDIFIYAYIEFSKDYFYGWLFDQPNLYYDILLLNVYKRLKGQGIEDVTVEDEIKIRNHCWKFSKKKKEPFTKLFADVEMELK